MHSPTHISLWILVPRINCPRTRDFPLHMRTKYVFPSQYYCAAKVTAKDDYESTFCRAFPGMEEQQIKAIHGYLTSQQYPLGYSKSKKYVLHHSCKNFKVDGEKLLCQDHRPDGSTLCDKIADSVFLTNQRHTSGMTLVGLIVFQSV